VWRECELWVNFESVRPCGKNGHSRPAGRRPARYPAPKNPARMAAGRLSEDEDLMQDFAGQRQKKKPPAWSTRLSRPASALARTEAGQGRTNRQSTGELYCWGETIGSVKLNVEPRPWTDWTQTRPPCAWTMCLTMDNPSPVPPNSLERALSTR